MVVREIKGKEQGTEILTKAEREIEEEGEVDGSAATVEGGAGAPANSFGSEVAAPTPTVFLATRRRQRSFNRLLGKASSTEKAGRELES